MSTSTTNTIRLHRVLRATPEKIYRAFLDADAMAKWLPPNGFTGKVHHIDAKVGGTYKMSFTNFTAMNFSDLCFSALKIFATIEFLTDEENTHAKDHPILVVR